MKKFKIALKLNYIMIKLSYFPPVVCNPTADLNES